MAVFRYTKLTREGKIYGTTIRRHLEFDKLPDATCRLNGQLSGVCDACSVLEQLSGVKRLVCEVLYGGRLRLEEALHMRVKDLDFGVNQITVRDGIPHCRVISP